MTERSKKIRQKKLFMAKIDFTDNCWLWTGALNKDGYGRFGTTSAHRYSYENFKGKLVIGMEVDHLCRVRNCVRPSHLEQVTKSINRLRSVPYRDYESNTEKRLETIRMQKVKA